MAANKTPWPILGLVFIGQLMITFLGIILLAILIDELAESGQIVPGFMQAYLAYPEAWQAASGDEFTGEISAWLFGASCIPVGIDLLTRRIILSVPFGDTVKRFIRRANNIQRQYLMPLHTYLSILALGLGILHLTLSSCIANLLPELGLILMGVLVITGLLFKWKAVSKTFRKALYQFHASLIVSGVLLVILYTGHAVMDLD